MNGIGIQSETANMSRSSAYKRAIVQAQSMVEQIDFDFLVRLRPSWGVGERRQAVIEQFLNTQFLPNYDAI
ncbi:hypothetical protein ACHMW6_24020 [Pseudoduganella sp. UC29_106]|uniref:hypothetical protein n=1 Tax=Pseudoduganella sp. UC29_106 TaxID=3374553 RepID=UPI0037563061